MKFSDLFFEEDEKQFDSRYDFIDKIVKPKTSRTLGFLIILKSVLKQ